MSLKELVAPSIETLAAHFAKNKLLLIDDFSAYDGMSRSVVKTENLGAEELEEFLVHAYDTWDRHALRRGGLWKRIARAPLASARAAIGNPRRALQFVTSALVESAKS